MEVRGKRLYEYKIEVHRAQEGAKLARALWDNCANVKLQGFNDGILRSTYIVIYLTLPI